MILIAGLGNPGKEYALTRHNVGYDVVERLSEKYNIRVDRIKFRSLTGEGIISGKKILLIKPLTYMNNSGLAISEALRFYKLTVDEDRKSVV